MQRICVAAILLLNQSTGEEPHDYYPYSRPRAKPLSLEYHQSLSGSIFYLNPMSKSFRFYQTLCHRLQHALSSICHLLQRLRYAAQPLWALLGWCTCARLCQSLSRQSPFAHFNRHPLPYSKAPFQTPKSDVSTHTIDHL